MGLNFWIKVSLNILNFLSSTQFQSRDGKSVSSDHKIFSVNINFLPWQHFSNLTLLQQVRFLAKESWRWLFSHFSFPYKNVMLQLILHFAFHFLVKLQFYTMFLLISIMKVLLRTAEHQKFVCKKMHPSQRA